VSRLGLRDAVASGVARRGRPGRNRPDGRAGEDIPLVARIVCCCDAFHAMTSDRSYRKALSHEDALAGVRTNSGTQFDPLVVDALVEAVG
jgi:HD-GYP domain-containing protein (c-di-GMP phosphodiesterase class II)